MIEKLDKIRQDWFELDMNQELYELTNKINELIEASNEQEEAIREIETFLNMKVKQRDEKS